MGDPGLFQEIPDIAVLLPEGGGDGEQACPADGAVGRLNTIADLLRWMTAGRKALSAALLVGSIPSISRKVHNPSATFRMPDVNYVGGRVDSCALLPI